MKNILNEAEVSMLFVQRLLCCELSAISLELFVRVRVR